MQLAPRPADQQPPIEVNFPDSRDVVVLFFQRNKIEKLIVAIKIKEGRHCAGVDVSGRKCLVDVLLKQRRIN